VLARGGHEVRLYDEQPGSSTTALNDIDGMLALFEAGGLLGHEGRESAFARVHPSESLAEAVSDAGYVQECVPEIVGVKQSVTSAIAELAPADAILASSTSGLVPSSFTAYAVGRERCLVAHPINPVHLHSLVEVVPAPWTADGVVERTVALLRQAGLEPVRLTREVDGFLVNRLQCAVLQEAFRLVDDGVATAEDVDTAVRSGLAPRWSFMGPFETIDLNAPNGIADYVERYEPMYQRLAAEQTEIVDWSATLESGLLEQRRAALPIADLPARRMWRDQQLLAFLKHRNRSEGE
jgi:3-hydroxyacyl-CoA dehydrogenase